MNKTLQDLVWSILPKEFKEEVMKIYNHNVGAKPMPENMSRGKSILRDIFGHDNLTSTSEEAVIELLYVTRQKVMGLLANAKKIHGLYTTTNCINNEESQQRDMCTGTICVLLNLFGSKCLPDEEPPLKITAAEDCVRWAKEEMGIAEHAPSRKKSQKMKPIESMVSVYLATKEEDEEFRMLLHENGFQWNGGNLLIDSSCWDSDIQESKIHFVYPDKTVTYCGEKASDTLTFSEFKKQYFGEEFRNLSQSSSNCDKEFDNILRDSFSKDRRLNLAIQILSGMLSNQEMLSNLVCGETTTEGVVKCIVNATMMYTDALITECDKGGPYEED